MKHRVGVVVRTKDRPYFLARALEDIAAQTFTDAEVIVVNDHGDLARVKSIVAASPVADRARVVDVPDPGGRCLAANTGIRATEAEYVVLHDDDDLWHPQFLARTVAHLDAHPQDSGVSSATEIIFEERRGRGWHEVGRAPFWAGLQHISITEMLEVNRAVPISVLYRRAVHESVGWYDEDLDAVEDWEFYLRVLATGRLGFIPDVLAYWTQRPTAAGSSANSMFGLSAEHARDDRVVRDRALAEWIAREGAGVPLQLAGMEERLRAHIDARFDALAADVGRQIDAHQPVWSRLRRVRRLFRRR